MMARDEVMRDGPNDTTIWFEVRVGRRTLRAGIEVTTVDGDRVRFEHGIAHRKARARLIVTTDTGTRAVIDAGDVATIHTTTTITHPPLRTPHHHQ